MSIAGAAQVYISRTYCSYRAGSLFSWISASCLILLLSKPRRIRGFAGEYLLRNREKEKRCQHNLTRHLSVEYEHSPALPLSPVPIPEDIHA